MARVRTLLAGLMAAAGGFVILGAATPVCAADELDTESNGPGVLQPDLTSRESPSHPFGKPHPDASPQLVQFAFLIGEFTCSDRIRDETRGWLDFQAVWRGRYTLGGMAIQDEYWTARVFTTNLRIFDPALGRWTVHFYRITGYSGSSWHGGQQDDRMVMRREGSDDEGPTFFEISRDGFRWHSGGPDPGWTSTCRRS